MTAPKRPLAFGYTRCYDCGIRLCVSDNDRPDVVIGNHRVKDCPKNPHPTAPKKNKRPRRNDIRP